MDVAAVFDGEPTFARLDALLADLRPRFQDRELVTRKMVLIAEDLRRIEGLAGKSTRLEDPARPVPARRATFPSA